jgi:hypothetical protein
VRGLDVIWSCIKSGSELADQFEVEITSQQLNVDPTNQQAWNNVIEVAWDMATFVQERIQREAAMVHPTCCACRTQEVAKFFICSNDRHAYCALCMDDQARNDFREMRISSAGDVFCLGCRDGRSVFVVTEMMTSLKPCTIALWQSVIKKQASFDAHREVRLQHEATDATIAKLTKKCPKCSYQWIEPINCNHVTCHKERGGCGFEFCWLCLCDYRRVISTDNSAHEPHCRYHPSNLH